MAKLTSIRSIPCFKRISALAIVLIVLTYLRTRFASTVRDPFDVELKKEHVSAGNGSLFVDKYCNLEGVAEWQPERNNTWQRRAPYFLLVGPNEVDTTSLVTSLTQHSRIVPPRKKENQFFMTTGRKDIDANGKVRVRDTRRHIYATDTYRVDTLKDHAHMISFATTPEYLFYSSLVTPQILCTFPWVKILVILQDPIDRIWSHYNSLPDVDNDNKSLEDFITADMIALRKAGVVPEEGAVATFADIDAEDKAWKTYLESSGREGPVGRGLYAMQLRPWFQALEQMGRDPHNSCLVVRYEDMMHTNANVIHNHIIEWLDLPSESLEEFQLETNDTSREMKSETRLMLQKVYAPYNQRLYDMLGGGDWDSRGSWGEPPKVTFAPTSPLPKQETETVKPDSPVVAPSIAPTTPAKSTKQQTDSPTLPELEMQSSSPSMTTWDPTTLTDNTNLTTIPTVDGSNVTESTNVTTVNSTWHYKLSSFNESKGNEFAEQWCQLQSAEWFPSDNDAWQMRAPYFLIPGAKDSGSTSMTSRLLQHPLVVPTRTPELQFFLNKNFRRYLTTDQKTHVRWARQAMYARDYHPSILKTNESFVSFDATSNYLFLSPIMPQRILCVCPWIKLVIILRNPVDRVIASYIKAIQSMGWTGSLSDWVTQDLVHLRDVGLVGNKNKKFRGSTDEDEAWMNYLLRTTEGPVGRSMYEIQLRHWFRTIRDMGRDPKDTFHFVRYNDWKIDQDGQYAILLDFLGLPQQPLGQNATMGNATQLLASQASFDEEETKIRATLQKLFAPHNKRLYKLLGPEWDGCWD